MGKVRAQRVWDGRSMTEGLDAGRLQVRTALGSNVDHVTPARLRPLVVEATDPHGFPTRVRRVEFVRRASVTLREIPAERPVVVDAETWTPALVEARLQRSADIYRATPGGADIWPAGYKSCMPTPVREPFRDWENDKPRVLPSHEETSLATRTAEWLLDVLFDAKDSTRFALAEAVGWRLKWRKVARVLRRRADCQSLSDKGAKLRARRVLDDLARAWTQAGHRFDVADVRLAEALAAHGKSVL